MSRSVEDRRELTSSCNPFKLDHKAPQVRVKYQLGPICRLDFAIFTIETTFNIPAKAKAASTLNAITPSCAAAP